MAISERPSDDARVEALVCREREHPEENRQDRRRGWQTGHERSSSTARSLGRTHAPAGIIVPMDGTSEQSFRNRLDEY
ncbi:MAG: hypothetical protein PVG07_16680, partial [Acidobacteriota bacterium]